MATAVDTGIPGISQLGRHILYFVGQKYQCTYLAVNTAYRGGSRHDGHKGVIEEQTTNRESANPRNW